MDKMREDFEAWFKSAFHLADEHLSEGKYGSETTQTAWLSWQASRKALVVNIDSHDEFEIEYMASPKKDGYPEGWIDGRNYSVRQVEYAGITVKQ